jgi:hypothetical protein
METTENAEPLSPSNQVIWNTDRWGPITATGLFEAQKETRLKFHAIFSKGDTPGKVKVAGLTLIATVIGNASLQKVAQNLARQEGATASQSSDAYTGAGKAVNAIDGNTNGNWKAGSVTHTINKPDSWWQVKLPKSAEIEKIVIWNRSDCCGNRLSNFRVSVTSDSPGDVWHQDFKGPVAQGGYETFTPMSPITGRTVKIQIQGRNLANNGVLSLAEVQIIGENKEK